MSWLRRMWSRKFNQSSDDDYYREIQIPRFCLGITGVWSERGNTNRIRFFISVTTVILFAALPNLVDMLTTVNENQLFFQIGLVMFYYYLISCMFLLHFNSQLRGSILEEMRDNWETIHSVEDKQVMRHYAECSRKISFIFIALKVYTVFGKSAGCGWFNLIVSAFIRGENVLAGTNKMKFLFHRSGTFVDALGSTSFVIGDMLSNIASLGIDTCFTVLTVHTCGRLVILKNRITTYERQTRHHFEEDIPRMCSCLKCIVDAHVKIYDSVRRIDDYFHVVTFLRLSAGMINFVCIGFEVSKAVKNKDYGFLMTFTNTAFLNFSTFFLNCETTEMCQQASYALGHAAYSTEWLTKHPRISRNLIFIINQTRAPLKFTALKYFVLSRNLFKEYFITAISYISTLISIKLAE
ncbi:uncharacterized protein LOC114841130 isoform X1 [Diachasma alloeum]|uniref:Odorant receptor n=1 Tax=Diachasma alloeum TaxID=454923 RepID=A0A4E0S4F9_9HYME|nr:uncharacterized protein LOC114841130 isoform X1 [Diachasma alloeum]THK32973.1 odorant receptor 45 [Diachasma alloeum]